MTNYRPLPPLAQLRALFVLAPIPPARMGEWSGLFRKIDRGRFKAGSVAGSKRPCLHRQGRTDWTIGVDGFNYMVSRIIYYMLYEKDPADKQVDHKDQNPLNNNAWNLRLDTEGDLKEANKPLRVDNTSGVVGVDWHKKSRRWRARVLVQGKSEHLGYFTCKLEAAHVVRDKWIELGWDKLGRKLPNLNKIECDCFDCSNMTARPSDPAE